MTVLLLEEAPGQAVLHACFVALRTRAHVVTVFRPVSPVVSRLTAVGGDDQTALQVTEASREQGNAMALLGLTHEQWGFRGDEQKRLARRLEELAEPEYGYTEAWVHTKAVSVREAIEATDFTVHLYGEGYQVLPDGPEVLGKLKALACYPSLIEASPDDFCYLDETASTEVPPPSLGEVVSAARETVAS